MKLKKGQMKIQQMAFMLIGVTIFFVMVGLFLASIGLSSLKEKKELLDEQNAAIESLNLAKSPEFSCANAFGTTKINCVDFDKVLILSEKEDYFSFWGVEGIEIRRIYPKSENEFCTKENYPDCERLVLKEAKNPENEKSAFISLCHKEPYESTSYNKCEIARLTVKY